MKNPLFPPEGKTRGYKRHGTQISGHRKHKTGERSLRCGRSLGFRGQSCFDIEFFQHPGKAYLWGERMESILAVVAGNDVELFPEGPQGLQQALLKLPYLFVVFSQFAPGDDDLIGLICGFDDEVYIFPVRFRVDIVLDIESGRYFLDHIDDIYGTKIQPDDIIYDIECGVVHGHEVCGAWIGHDDGGSGLFGIPFLAQKIPVAPVLGEDRLRFQDCFFGEHDAIETSSFGIWGRSPL